MRSAPSPRLRWPRSTAFPTPLPTASAEAIAQAGALGFDNATTAASRAGLRVLEVFHQTPVWALSPAADAGDGVRATQTNMPRDLREVYTWCQWLARRFKGKVFAYEPWNGTVLDLVHTAVLLLQLYRHYYYSCTSSQ